MKVHYFSPGPATLPDHVKERILAQMQNPFGIGVGIMEISHRNSLYEELSHKITRVAEDVFGVPKSHKLFFTPFGAQQHFSLLIHHLSKPGDTISYTDTGVWAHFACKEALASQRQVELVFDGSSNQYRTLGSPETWEVSPHSKFVHLTVNNTVYGTEYPKIPTFGEIPLVLDMTSALAARTDIPWDKTALVYASAQKNFGIAGVSAVIVREDILEASKDLCKANLIGNALQYDSFFKAKSALNTPPVFPIFAMGVMLDWIKQQGGTPAMEKLALAKAKRIYDEVDSAHGQFYIGHTDQKYRSRHNFVFRLPDATLDEEFISAAQKEGILEVRGYRVLGGIRASAYNGLALESVQVLGDFMKSFREKKGF